MRTALPPLAVVDAHSLRERLAAGDAAAFRELYQAQAPRLLRLLQRLLGDAGLAEEILQDTFLAAFESARDFRGEASLATWLARIALRRALNARRGRARRREETKEEGEMRAHTSQTAPAGPEALDLARRLLALMNRLEPRKRQASSALTPSRCAPARSSMTCQTRPGGRYGKNPCAPLHRPPLRLRRSQGPFCHPLRRSPSRPRDLRRHSSRQNPNRLSVRKRLSQ